MQHTAHQVVDERCGNEKIRRHGADAPHNDNLLELVKLEREGNLDHRDQRAYRAHCTKVLVTGDLEELCE